MFIILFVTSFDQNLHTQGQVSRQNAEKRKIAKYQMMASYHKFVLIGTDRVRHMEPETKTNWVEE
jgi:hypothetical protein